MWTTQSKILCHELAIDVPIVQAPMAGGPSSPELVAAVSNAGALGSIGAGYLKADALAAQIDDVLAQTSRPYAVNLFAPEASPQSELSPEAEAELRIIAGIVGLENFDPVRDAPALFDDQVAVLLDREVPIVSFTFGALPPEVMTAFQGRGTKLIGTATSTAEAASLVDVGCDMVVAQGSEAGGHRGSFLPAEDPPMVGTIALVPQICDAVDIPVLAAGGIMDGRGIAAAIVLGAAGAQMGTAFLAVDESGAGEKWVERLSDSDELSTTVTKSFSGKAARGIRNDFIVRMRKHEESLPAYPVQNQVTTPIRAAAKKAGLSDYMSLWAGQGAGLTRRLPAADLVRELVDESRTAFDSAAG